MFCMFMPLLNQSRRIGNSSMLTPMTAFCMFMPMTDILRRRAREPLVLQPSGQAVLIKQQAAHRLPPERVLEGLPHSRLEHGPRHEHGSLWI